MTFVISKGCCNDGSCVTVCPVQCIRPRPGDADFTTAEQLYIDPATCIDCGACLDECPVEAVHPEWELPEHLSDYLDINAEYFAANPLADVGPPSFAPRALPTDRPELRVAIVGTGPAACYAAGILSDIKGVAVTMLERLPTPFGLVRGGVAPDHPNTKKMADRFGGVLSRPAVTSYFNVEVGRDLTIGELLRYHHAVLWAGGAPDDRKLGVAGEHLPGVHAARNFVAWYNGHPDHAGERFGLDGERVVVIGNGNVALDVARTLLRPADALSVTDMAQHAVDALAAGNVSEVVVVARRGPEHAAYSQGELLALDQLEGVTVVAEADEVGAHDGDRKQAVLRRAAGRGDAAGKVVRFRFGLEPVAIEGGERVEAVTFRRPDGGTERIETALVLRAIGYRGARVDGLPFDEATATLPHESGRVVDPERGEVVVGVYCSGWIKRGPRGVIGSNKQDAEETVAGILDDLASDRLADPTGSPEDFARLLRDRVADLLDKTAWDRIDREEKRRGREASRPRQKLVTIQELLAASRAAS
ncbi:FAD-dependent oxidoreductase [Yinghuangia sp. ASG 101]|uniref:FAD-dependent oxidoreductase n=1 Tax=Yinghuangia sp. ASG 101 TaxID=2896848 RepID=UPI001E516A8B|nr:FAD-dependent oxidoreductase [Yinghuangia sp. ASG 101]UGQ11147.1 FAD-dependent oxidoreductase [Yinghuangia sp. ASG 101]